MLNYEGGVKVNTRRSSLRRVNLWRQSTRLTGKCLGESGCEEKNIRIFYVLVLQTSEWSVPLEFNDIKGISIVLDSSMLSLWVIFILKLFL